MKKTVAIIALALVLVSSLFVFTSCGAATKTDKCDSCGKTATLKKITIAGEEGWLCDDCHKIMEAFGSLAGF